LIGKEVELGILNVAASLGGDGPPATVLCVSMHMTLIIGFKEQMSTYENEKSEGLRKYLMIRYL
jgi:hypothetical protein